MKTLLLLCLVATCFTAARVSGETGEADHLYTSDGKPLKLADFRALLETQFKNKMPVVLYVHGRAKMPVRSPSKRRIERQHGVVCVMFRWDSAFPGLKFWDRERPLSMTPGAAAKLREVLAQIPPKADRGDAKVTLLVHSMGNLVLQQVVDSGGFEGRQLFDNILMVEPDCDAQGHVAWVGLLARQEKVFITLNRHDTVLNQAGATRPPGVFSLGIAVNEPKAENARYLDLTGLVGNNHRLFSLGALESQVCVAETIRGILRGESGLPAPAHIAEQTGPVIRLKSHQDAAHAIFRNQADLSEPEADDD
jgi:hypothetical protein